MSTNASVPSTSSQRSSGLDRSHSIVSRGTNETSSAARSLRSGSVVAISWIVRCPGARAKNDLEAFARDQRWLLVALNDRRHLLVELVELGVGTHGIVMEERELSRSGRAGERS